MTTAAIVQARARSTRLPGKALLPLAGGTVLREVLQRCALVPGVDVVCCAVPEGVGDDAVASEAEVAGAAVVRGSETDVLARYLKAARALDADFVLRVTSDCPLIDPALCGEVIALRAARGADYASNNMPRTFPHGLDCEAFTAAALAEADRRAHEPREREHVTPWLREHPSVRRANIEGPGGDAAQQRWTLDYPEDYAFFEALFAVLPHPAPTDWREVAAVVARHPEIAALNAHRHAA